jgi:uncharacterized membrane protein (UPF0127 family)
VVRVLGIILVLLVIAGCGGGKAVGSGATAQSPGPRATTAERPTDSGNAASDLRTVTLNASSGEEVKVRIEIADNQMGRVIGLRWRKSLPEKQGMLFVYTDEEKRYFTMDDTVIPLSIAFMDSEGRIIDIQNMKPLESGPYVSAEPAQYALEVNRGFFEERGVKVGDRAELPV